MNIKRLYQKKQLELIVYGGDQVQKVTDDSLYEKYPFCKEPYACTVCRIELENNVHVILEAFSKLQNTTEAYVTQLVMVGN